MAKTWHGLPGHPLRLSLHAIAKTPREYPLYMHLFLRIWQLSCHDDAFRPPPRPFGATSHFLSIRPAVSYMGSFSIAINGYALPFTIYLNLQLPVTDLHSSVIKIPRRAIMLVHCDVHGVRERTVCNHNPCGEITEVCDCIHPILAECSLMGLRSLSMV